MYLKFRYSVCKSFKGDLGRTTGLCGMFTLYSSRMRKAIKIDIRVVKFPR